jgi:hypothetical protein
MSKVIGFMGELRVARNSGGAVGDNAVTRADTS